MHSLIDQMACHKDNILLCARALGKLDVVVSMAELAHSHRYTRPILDYSNELVIKGGIHPILQDRLGPKHCVPNDTVLNGQQYVYAITAPNMSGKSIFLRQNALIVLMAHIGSFVPAESTRIGLVDQIFCRIGTDDNMSAGHSTFMQEMVETASIVNSATGKSLVIIDELGRGTSTRDGMAILLSVLEFLHNIVKCRTIIATHYHEAISLMQDLKGVAFFTFDVNIDNEQISFSRTLKPGTCSKSCGILVAKLAGLNNMVIARAEDIIEDMH